MALRGIQRARGNGYAFPNTIIITEKGTMITGKRLFFQKFGKFCWAFGLQD